MSNLNLLVVVVVFVVAVVVLGLVGEKILSMHTNKKAPCVKGSWLAVLGGRLPQFFADLEEVGITFEGEVITQSEGGALDESRTLKGEFLTKSGAPLTEQDIGAIEEIMNSSLIVRSFVTPAYALGYYE